MATMLRTTIANLSEAKDPRAELTCVGGAGAGVGETPTTTLVLAGGAGGLLVAKDPAGISVGSSPA